ncbi:MAG TPA: endo-1,4-beta-xylanase [Stellaceae bacterium]|nr:endo-1,4-beta-xylanase [Stellaceae bacterium]
MQHKLPWSKPVPSRRRLLATGLALLGTGAVTLRSLRSRAAETVTLRKLAAEKGLLYGTTVAAAQITGDPPFADLVRQEASLVVAENEMKWQVINRGAPGDDDFAPADTIATFAAANKLVLRGHNLLWYHRTPEWFFDLPDKAAQRQAVVEHIQQLAGRYRGRIHSWDVVNEPIEPKDGRPDGLRTAVFLETLGPEYLDLAYRTARDADPNARLVVNEYDVELDAPEQEARRIALLHLLEGMRRSGTPVDAVGIQAHLTAAGGPPFSASLLRRFLADIASLGLMIQITELDVTDEKVPADVTVRDNLVADTYRRFLNAALDEPAVKMVVTWGLSDRHSWIVRRETYQAKWRIDDAASRPLPFDADLEAKPAFDAIAGAFAHAPERKAG